MGKPQTKDIDKGYKAIFKELRKLEENPYVKIGIQAQDASKQAEGGPSLIVIAASNEFGTDRIPERSYIRKTHDENINEWSDLIKGLKDKIYQGSMTVDQALDFLGLTIETAIKAKIQTTDPDWEPNAPMTIEQKGSDKPLIDTGQLINSIRYQKFMKGEK